MNFPTDVLLEIWKHCNPIEKRYLALSCKRLASLNEVQEFNKTFQKQLKTPDATILEPANIMAGRLFYDRQKDHAINYFGTPLGHFGYSKTTQNPREENYWKKFGLLYEATMYVNPQQANLLRQWFRSHNFEYHDNDGQFSFYLRGYASGVLLWFYLYAICRS